MQVTETARDGLKRTLQVVVDQAELGERFSVRLDELKDRVQLKGFRKGKVPVPHLKKLYGKAVMQEVLEQAVSETSQKALKERNERPAQAPKIELVGESEGVLDRLVEGQGELSYSMSFEVLPPIPVTDLSALSFERLVSDVEDEAVTEALDELATRNTAFEPEEGRAAEEGDLVTMDFVGRIDGVEFDGGKAEGASLQIGKKQFIPGFEEGVVGMKAGDNRIVSATFPQEYPMPTLAGKRADFDVTVKSVSKPLVPAIDDAFAVGLGVDTLDKLKGLIGEQIKTEYDQGSRMKLKREILDTLDNAHNFELPASLVEFEFQNIWRDLENNLKAQGKTLADEGKTEDEAKDEYRKIAERRVRLGLVIGEIGEKNKLAITQDELRRALVEQARRFPGREKMVYEYYEKTPGALNELRAPIFEDKVIDHVISQAKVTDKKVSSEELKTAVAAATQDE